MKIFYFLLLLESHEVTGNKMHRKLRAKRHSTHLDMTPMVDLAFLLLTFFILTTTFMEHRVMDITMPVKDGHQDVPVSQTITILLSGEDRLMWYAGEDDALHPPEMHRAEFSKSSPNSIHKILLQKNNRLITAIKAVKDSVAAGLIAKDEPEIKKHIAAVKSAGKKGLIFLIKSDDKTKYKNLVDLFDEMLICSVNTYAIMDPSLNELSLIEKWK
jgi:biopolymer transport protein ExbD